MVSYLLRLAVFVLGWMLLVTASLACWIAAFKAVQLL